MKYIPVILQKAIFGLLLFVTAALKQQRNRARFYTLFSKQRAQQFLRPIVRILSKLLGRVYNSFFQGLCPEKMNCKHALIAVPIIFLLNSCATKPPSDINNICNIFKQYPQWYSDSKDVERRWRVPVPIQMAIIHQESKFDAHARPSRTKLLRVLPWARPSSAYGYAQALHSTWNVYKQSNGSVFSSRDDFGSGVDFIGWYANEAYNKAKIPRTDAYSLYLAYHEGVGGYQRKTYLRKPWLLHVARKVRAKASLYSMQLNSCQASMKKRAWY